MRVTLYDGRHRGSYSLDWDLEGFRHGCGGVVVVMMLYCGMPELIKLLVVWEECGAGRCFLWISGWGVY